MARARDRHISLRDIGCFVAVVEIHAGARRPKYWGKIGLARPYNMRQGKVQTRPRSVVAIRPKYIVERIVVDKGGQPLRMQEKYIIQLSKIGARVHDAIYDLRIDIPRIGARVEIENRR